GRRGVGREGAPEAWDEEDRAVDGRLDAVQGRGAALLINDRVEAGPAVEGAVVEGRAGTNDQAVVTAQAVDCHFGSERGIRGVDDEEIVSRPPIDREAVRWLE